MRINEFAGRYAPDWIYLYDKKTGICNMTAAQLFGIELKTTIKNPIHIEFQKEVKLRDYQKEPLDELLEKPYWLLRAFVAFGKTFSIGYIAHKLQARTVILCNTKVNAQQCAERLKEFFGNDKVGMFYSESKEFKDITVVVYPSFKKLLELHNWEFDILIQDECDLLLSDEFRLQTIKAKCQYKYWLTGTPYNDTFRLLDMSIRWGRIVEAKEYNEKLINQFNFNIFWVEAGEKITEYEHYRDLKKQINKQDDRMNSVQFAIQEGLKNGNRVIVLTDTKEFTRKIETELWYPAMTGDDSKKTRTEKFLRFEEVKVLCATSQIIWRWRDCPEVDVVIIAFSGRAEANIVQAVGRWLRSKEGKKDIYVYDLFNPTWLMRNQRSQRKKYYEKFTKEIGFVKFS